jgi:hypothetical protein
MTRRAATLALLTASLGGVAPGLTADDKISLHVTPTVSREPAMVNVRAQIERSPENRSLEVTAESVDYFRSSTINLDGEQAPLTTYIALKNLPEGDYRISAVLVDNRGRRSTALSSAIVIGAAGHAPPQH